MSNIIDLILSTETLDMREYARTRTEEPNVGNQLFPSIKASEFKIEYIKGSNGLPVAASVYAPDTKTKLSGRDSVEQSILELLLVKDSKRFGEELLYVLANPRNNLDKKQTLKKIFDDINNTIDAVYTRINMMRFEALQTGKLILNENGISGEIDYNMPADHQVSLTGTNKWGTGTAKPLDDIYSWVDKAVVSEGVTPTRALTTRAVMNMLLKDATIIKAIHGTSEKLVTQKDFNDLMVSMDLPQFAIYDGKYRDQNRVVQSYMNENTVVLMPDGPLGNTHFGMTAEEIELIQSNGIDEHYERDFITSIVWREPDPVARITKAVARAIPSFEACNEVIVAKVK